MQLADVDSTDPSCFSHGQVGRSYLPPSQYMVYRTRDSIDDRTGCAYASPGPYPVPLMLRYHPSSSEPAELYDGLRPFKVRSSANIESS